MAAKKTARKPVSKPARKSVKRASAIDVLKAEAEQAQVLPLEYMLQVLNARAPVREAGEPAESFFERMAFYETRRMDAAKAAAPYIHAKPAAVVKIDAPPVEDKPVNVLELAKKVAFLFTMAQARPEVDVSPLKLN